MDSELSRCVQQWRWLYKDGAQETSAALQKCKWNDGVGKEIKDQVSEIVECHVRKALDSAYVDQVSDIDLTDFEKALEETEEILNINSNW